MELLGITHTSQGKQPRRRPHKEAKEPNKKAKKSILLTSSEKARVEVYKNDTKGYGRKRPAISNCPPPSSSYVVADTTHIVILMQLHPISAPGTYADFHSLDHAMQGICSQYELGSQKRNSIMGNSQYTLDDVYAFVDSHADMSAFVLADADLQTYRLKDKSWIKEQLKSRSSDVSACI